MNQQSGLQKYDKVVQWLKDNLKYHLVNSAAQVSVATPIMAAYETFIVGISDEQSLYARLLGASLTFLGAGYLEAKFRDRIRKKFNVKGTSPEYIQGPVDTGSKIVFNLVRFPAVYTAIGVRSLEELGKLTGFGVGYSVASGYFSGYAMDLASDLTGMEESQRIPRFIRNRSKSAKKVILAGLIASTLLLTGGIYLTSDNNGQQQTIEQSVESATPNAKNLESILTTE